MVDAVGLAAVQLHGSEPLEDLNRLAPIPVIKAFRVRGPSTLQEAKEYLAQARSFSSLHGILLDAFRPGEAGGTGDSWDWSLLGEWKPSIPWLLAGGIHPKNVEESLRHCRPTGIDLASGVESSPGIKDRHKVESLLKPSHVSIRSDDSR